MYAVDPLPILFFAVVFGAVTSYTDVKHGKIRNIHVLLLIAAGLLLNVFYTRLLLYPSLDPKSDFFQTVTNMAISLLFGFSLYMAGLMPAADAKLFFGYATLLPVFIYKHGYVSYFPSLVLLINSVIPVAIFYITTSLLRMDLKFMKKEVKESFSPKNLAKTILFIFGLFFIFQPVFSYFNFQPDVLTSSVILFICMELTKKIKPSHLYVLCVILSVARIIFFYSTIASVSFLANFFTTLFAFVLLRILISGIVDFSFTKDVKIKDLRPGMILGECLVREKGGFVKKESMLFTIFDIFRSVKESFSLDVCTSLTEKDIRKLKEYRKGGKLEFNTVKIANTVPFAPFLFFGVLLTFFLQGSLFYYLHL